MNRKRTKTVGIVAGILFLIAVATLYVYLYVVPSVSGALTPTAIVQYGQMQTSNPAECIVYRSESIVSAQQSGNAAYYVEEGAKTRHGVKIADIYPSDGSGVGYYMESTGIVSYWYDGLEDAFPIDQPQDITLDLFPSDATQTEKPAEPQSVRTDSKEKGDPLYKVVHGDSWYMAFRIESQYKDRYAMNARIEVQFDNGLVDAVITRMTQYQDYWVVLARSSRYFPDSAKLRYCDVVIITEDNTGLLIPTTARTMKEQEDGTLREGVYVKTIRGDYIFRPIRVLAEDPESCKTLVVSDSFSEAAEDGTVVQIATIGVYDEVLRDAGVLSDVDVTEEEPEEEEIVFEWEKTKQEQEEQAGQEDQADQGDRAE